MRLARRLFAAKRRRRRELARLSFPEKLAIIAAMQRVENCIRRASGRPPRPAWDV